MNILVMDDDEAIRQVLVDFLELEGFQVEAVGTLEQGYAAIERHPFGLVVTDSFVQGWHPSNLGHFRQLTTLASGTPVLLLTGHEEAMQLSLPLYGLAGVLPKPFDLNDLLTSIQDATEPA